jgi:hypothetical protein
MKDSMERRKNSLHKEEKSGERKKEDKKEYLDAKKSLTPTPKEALKLTEEELTVLSIIGKGRKIFETLYTECNAPRKAVGKLPLSKEELHKILEDLKNKELVNLTEVWSTTEKAKSNL